jgi:ubiquinone/menaquinone biosynthesis C-methylase UbiE
MNKFFLLIMQIVLTVKRNTLIKRFIHKDMTLIADFGCGHFPSKYANVLVDSTTSLDEQRGGLSIQTTDSSTFHNLDLNIFPYPFPDKHFDFLICSHVLEHLDDPVRTISEFSRIAKGGYIEVPFYCVDLYIRNNDVIHKWLCAYDQKNESMQFVERKSFLEHLPPRHINLLLRFIIQFKNISIVWKEQIRGAYLNVNAFQQSEIS